MDRKHQTADKKTWALDMAEPVKGEETGQSGKTDMRGKWIVSSAYRDAPFFKKYKRVEGRRTKKIYE